MNRNELADLLHLEADESTITAPDLAGPDRTLLYGYDCDRITWHVYLAGGLIHLYRYNLHGTFTEHTSAEAWNASDLVPNKRAYPDSTDHTFARLLAQHGHPACFTTYSDERHERNASSGSLFFAKTAPDGM